MKSGREWKTDERVRRVEVRPALLAAFSFGAAALGAAAVLAVGEAAGWLGGSHTVIEQPRLVDAGQPAAVASPAPLTGSGFRPAAIFRARGPGVVLLESDFAGSALGGSVSQGSGFVVSRTGLILTDAHVITTAGQAAGPARAARSVYVQFSDGDRVPARIVGYDLYDDVGVVRVDPAQHALRPVPLGDSARVVVGEPVAAIGSPFGDADSLSVGVVSAVGRSIPSLTTRYALVDAIQTDAPINHGNSGGPLLDAQGRAIGITAQIRSDGSGTGFEGVGFAVPIDSARRSLQQLLRHGKVSYAYVGISTEDLTPSIARALDYTVTRGAIVDDVRPRSPGAAAGFRAGTHDALVDGVPARAGGDVVVAIDGMPVDSAADVVRIVAERLLPGETARFVVVRAAKRLVLRVRLAARPG